MGETRIVVTWDDINWGIQDSCVACPIALATKRCIRPECDVEVGIADFAFDIEIPERFLVAGDEAQ